MIFNKGTKPKVFKARRSGVIVRKTLAVVFLALAVFIGFYFIPLLYEQKANTDMIVVAAADINKGEIIDPSKITVNETGIYGLEGYYTDTAAVAGMVALTDIKKSDIIFENKISGFEESALLTLANDPRGLLTITVRSNAAGLASHLRSGAIVNVYNIIEEAVESEEANAYYANRKNLIPVLNPLLENLEVFGIEYSGNTNSVSTITFYTESKDQEIELLKAEYDGIIHIALVEL